MAEEKQQQQNSWEDENWTPEESTAVFERAAELQSHDAFADKSDDLDRTTLDKSAGRAGIDPKYVELAVEELRKERRAAQEQKMALQQAKLARQRLLKKIAVPAAVIFGLYLLVAYSSLNNKYTAVEKQQAQLENVLQRRHDLIPNLINSSKFAAAHEKEVFNSLSQLEKQSKNTSDLAQRAQLENQLSASMREALNSLRDNSGGSRIFFNLSTQMEGAENRISVERKRYNDAAAEYNRITRTFPLFLVRPLLGFPAQKSYFQAESAAREVPRF